MIDLAAASVLARLDCGDQVALAVHRERGCPECEREIREASELAASLTPAHAAAPPHSLREKVLALTRATAPTPGLLHDEQGILIKRPDELEWKQFVPGIERKILHTDAQRRYRSYLLRFAPGARLFKHHHPEVEEVLVLSGDVSLHGIGMKTGDYCRAGADTVHEESYSEGGCVVFISASMDNRPVA
jgi:anti-sigma factor ChrR (cupin superfamily)